MKTSLLIHPPQRVPDFKRVESKVPGFDSCFFYDVDIGGEFQHRGINYRKGAGRRAKRLSDGKVLVFKTGMIVEVAK